MRHQRFPPAQNKQDHLDVTSGRLFPYVRTYAKVRKIWNTQLYSLACYVGCQL